MGVCDGLRVCLWVELNFVVLAIEEQRKTKILSAAATIARAANVLEGMFKNS